VPVDELDVIHEPYDRRPIVHPVNCNE
jgi:hypothetical protein